MPHPSAFALQLIDPRGRCSRKGLLLVAALGLALQASAGLAVWTSGADLAGHGALIPNAVFCWVGFTLVSKRLHDLGRSTWWIPTAALAWLASVVALAVAIALLGDLELLVPGTPSYWVIFGVMLAPLLVIAAWLHVAEGESGANRFGPAPAASGFSMPPETALWHRRPVPAGARAA